MEEEKNCAFQFATSPRWGGGKVIEDTDLITLSEAKELFKKYIPEFKRRLADEENPEMGIWTDMPDNHTYVTMFVHADRDTQVDSAENLYNIKKEYLNV